MVKLEMKRADEIIPAHAASAKPMLSEGSSPAPSRVPVLVGKRPERSGGEGWRRFCWQGPGGTWTDPGPVASLERKARGAKSLAEHPASCVLRFTPGPPRACLVDATSRSQKTATFSGKKIWKKERQSELPKCPSKGWDVHSERSGMRASRPDPGGRT